MFGGAPDKFSGIHFPVSRALREASWLHGGCSISGAKHSPPALSALVALRAEIPESKIIGDIESNNESFFVFFLSLG